MRAAPGAEIIPVDSSTAPSTSACGPGAAPSAGAACVLTASGGPFRGRSPDSLAAVRVDEALAHPTWSMGPKITIDSSTLMNKGLEVIEAHELFDIAFDRIEVVVHPQSIVHSMVEWTDGATMAQCRSRTCASDRLRPRLPRRLPSSGIDWSASARLTFEAPDRAGLPVPRPGLPGRAGRAGWPRHG